VPDALILQHSRPGQADVEPLASALLGELRGRFLNPAWLRPLMDNGYSGARTMGQEFIENLWGWQVTRPDLVKNWAWDEVKAVYFDDRHKLGLPEFLGQRHNAHVKAHMLAVFMVAAEKGYWKTDPEAIRRLGGELARLVAANGLPGSGHTAPDHSMWGWLAPQLDGADAQKLGVTLAKARGELLPAVATSAPSVAAPAQQAAAPDAGEASEPAPSAPAPEPMRVYELKQQPEPAQPAALRIVQVLAILAACLALFSLGLWRGRHIPQPLRSHP